MCLVTAKGIYCERTSTPLIFFPRKTRVLQKVCEFYTDFLRHADQNQLFPYRWMDIPTTPLCLNSERKGSCGNSIGKNSKSLHFFDYLPISAMGYPQHICVKVAFQKSTLLEAMPLTHSRLKQHLGTFKRSTVHIFNLQ